MKLTALAKYLKSVFLMTVMRVNISIHWLPDSSSELGYTIREKNKADVYLTKGNNEFMKDISDAEKTLMITGIAVHEFMHQIATNFVLAEKMRLALPAKERKLFHTIFNIFEDSRIESYAPSYFEDRLCTALLYTIQTIWDKSKEISPEENILTQVLNAMIQWGDIGLIKGSLSDEAEEVFNKILPLFNEAIDSPSCAVCLTKAKEAMKILLPYMPEDYEDPAHDSGKSDSTGEDLEDSEARSKRCAARKSVTASGKSKKPSDDDKSKEKAKEEPSLDEDKKDEEGSPMESEDGLPGDGKSGDDECKSYDGDIEEVEEEAGATEDEIEEAAKTLEEELKRLESEEEEKAKEEASDYDFGDVEHPSGDKFVKTISHHKAESVPDMYESYKSKVSADAHDLAKIIKKQFLVKPGRSKRSDHGDLNLMRYKDPNFCSPRIFDSKKPKQKHNAAVLLLVDESGSMSCSSRIGNARLATTMLAEAMAEANIPCCIVGHSGDSRYDTSVELEHYTTFKNAPADRASIPMISARCQNRDGPAIRWATSILKKRPERKKLMIIISDGQPAADAYYGDSAIFDTKSAIRDAKRLFDVAGVVLEAGNSADVLHTMYGEDYIECSQASQLKSCIMDLIKKRCKDW